VEERTLFGPPQSRRVFDERSYRHEAASHADGSGKRRPLAAERRRTGVEQRRPLDGACLIVPSPRRRHSPLLYLARYMDRVGVLVQDGWSIGTRIIEL
jgi:hypothetical protein